MLLAPADRNLILTGYTGPNQPAIGQSLAERLKLRFVDVDSLIEARAEMDADALRQRHGEARLKMVESEVMRDVLLYRGAVIRVSGQTLLHGEHARQLQGTGPIICLVVALDAVLSRLHLALGGRYHNPQERALAIGHLRREWAVRALEGIYELDVTYLDEEQTVLAVQQLWQTVVLAAVAGQTVVHSNGHENGHSNGHSNGRNGNGRLTNGVRSNGHTHDT